MTPRRILMRDDTLPHQIRLFFNGQDIAVSCTCLRGVDGTRAHHSPLEMRPRWEPGEALAVHAAHVFEARARELTP